MKTQRFLFLAGLVIAAASTPQQRAAADPPASNSHFGVRTLSTHADRVSGGDVLDQNVPAAVDELCAPLR